MIAILADRRSSNYGAGSTALRMKLKFIPGHAPDQAFGRSRAWPWTGPGTDLCEMCSCSADRDVALTI